MKRGLRNNNPLNIRRSATCWQGAQEEQKDKSFGLSEEQGEVGGVADGGR